MDSSFRKPLKIYRHEESPELLADGTYIKYEPTEYEIMACVQVLGANEASLLPEGTRQGRRVKVYTDVMLHAAEQNSNQLPDRFRWRGRMYEVTASDIFQNDVINHYRAYAVEVREF